MKMNAAQTLACLLVAQLLCTLPASLAVSVPSADSVRPKSQMSVHLFDGSGSSSYDELIKKHPVYNQLFATRSEKFLTKISMAEVVTDTLAQKVFSLRSTGQRVPADTRAAWAELKTQLRNQHKQNMAAVLFDEVHNQWKMCAVVKKWSPAHKHFQNAFERSPAFFQACANYNLVTGSSIDRESVNLADYISSTGIDTLRKEKNQMALGSSLRSKNSVLSPRVRSQCDSTKDICIDLFGTNDPTDPDLVAWIQRCLENTEASAHCKAFCCQTVYYSSNTFCEASAMSCITPQNILTV